MIRDWCWLGTASDDAALAQLLEALPRPEFDPDIARLLLRTLARGRHAIVPLPVPGRDDAEAVAA